MIDKPTVLGYLILALGIGIISGLLIGKNLLKEDIARAYMVSNCERTKDINGKYYKCEY